ncbi:glycosyltransferase [Helicobacter anatolicus]|uniref:glycosyltransferase n=1 Tax=Helicobacter anatolicus TaxID=2905874 RepID=UPI001E2CA7B6|nr:glycosyltransferase [Helicobacter anatolicus]MCE3038105.1 hypothetical protein [Helicobacter anatolicus]
MSNKIIQSFWYSKDPSKNSISVIEVLCVLSYLKNGHEFHLYTYTPNDVSMQFLRERIMQESQNNEIDLFKICDAREILDEDKIFFDDRGSVGIAAFSDYFRYHILKKKGSYWSDMDVICCKSFDFQEDYVFAMQRNDNEGEVMATTCIIKTPKECDFINTLLKRCDEILNDEKNIVNYSNGVKKVLWGVIGPELIDKMIQDFNMQKFLKTPNTFCEINWFEAKDFIKPKGYYKLQYQKDIYALHIWNAVWVDLDEKLDKNMQYDKESVLEVLKLKYLEKYQNNIHKSLLLFELIRFKNLIIETSEKKITKIKHGIIKRIKYVKNWRYSS